MKKKVVLGLSGGVDSSVCAYLLKEQGYDVTCLFMKNWDEENDSECTAYEDSQDALKVASKLDLPFYVVNFEKEYMDRVFSYFLEELKAGRTPNPDVMCNQEIKFKAFLDFAMTINADYIAMGHYARVIHKEGRSYLAKGKDDSKDQSYFLSRIEEEALKKTIFPIGALEKTEVRRIAEEEGFATANKKDSTGICFIGERNFDNFLDKHLKSEEGDIVDVDGGIVGRHKGLIHYTIGQRKGIGIGGVKSGEPWFVCKKDKKNNIVYVCQGKKHPALFYDYLICKDFKWINDEPSTFPIDLNAKFRYRQQDIAVIVKKSGDSGDLLIEFKEKVKAITPGQIAVLYDGEICLGGGIIEEGGRYEL